MGTGPSSLRANPTCLRVLLTGGRAPATLELARVLARAGHQVEVAESLSLHLCRFSRAVERCHRVPAPNRQPHLFAQALQTLMTTRAIDLLIPTCEETYWVAQARLAGAWCEPPEKLLPLHSKWQFQQRVAQHGLNPLQTQLCHSAEQLLPYLDGAHVIKPEYSRFAQKVLIQPRQPGLLSGTGPWVVQPFVEGREWCVFAMARAGRLLARAIYPSEMRLGQGSALRFRYQHHQALSEWLERFVAGEAYTGFVAFDFIEDQAGRLWPLECNPRLTSGIHLLADQAGLAELFWNDPTQVLTPRPGSLAQLSQALLLLGKSGWKEALAARDVLFCRQDPWPGLLQALTLLPLAARAVSQRISILEASTWDIEWNG